MANDPYEGSFMRLYAKIFAAAGALLAAWPVMANNAVVGEPVSYNPDFSFVGGGLIIDIEANELVRQEIFLAGSVECLASRQLWRLDLVSCRWTSHRPV
ncbi:MULTISPECIES: hypothetical protein [Mesorhizobium]|uniref:hypothetical protein n=1 Tax=Mesorhizobium TaxID=68287 RepID=UPI00037B0483|nr:MULTISPECIES: hypothetical protein [Mesorhizobium]OBP78547.1 hypothetical protein BAE41_30390 [Mesorhizobium loti]OBP97349.1 hypothetical protein BAE38_00115 [Mesorhizobium loti]OBQ69999.1 hypothetical protein A9K72_33805 [Mesorhizobium loti]